MRRRTARTPRPRALRFVRERCAGCGGEHGRPALDASSPPPGFSLSHSAGVALAGVAAVPVGVDVEPAGPATAQPAVSLTSLEDPSARDVTTLLFRAPGRRVPDGSGRRARTTSPLPRTGTMTSPSPRPAGRGQAATLVLAGTLTIMAGATVAPAIPGIREAFADTPNADLLARMITTTHALAIVLFSPVAGFVVERLGRKRALVTGMLAFGIGGSSGAYLPDLTGMLAGRAVLGIGVSLIMTSSMAMIADLYEGTDRQRLLGRQAAAGSFGGVVLLLGGGALAGLDWRVVFLLYLLGVLLVIPALAFLPEGRTATAPAPVGKGAAAPATSKIPAGILAALAAMMLGQVAFYSVPVQVPFLVEDHFKAAAVVSGAVMAVQTFTTGMVAMRFAFFRRLAGEYPLAALSFLAIGLGYLVLAVAPNVAVLVVALLIMGTGLGFLMPNLNNWVLAEAPAHVRARYAGLLTTALFLGQFLAPVLTQPLVSSLGIQPTFAVVAGAALLVAVAYYLGGRSVAGRERAGAGTPGGPDSGPAADTAAAPDTATNRRARKAAER
ncbi:MFS transporter [Streptomyces sp. NPDC058612]|uniref:MFS transporter n=1 Tax=Streptomyces sp. NPDC058612 TaxID=3346555 RepID=UPI0036515F2A